MNHTKIFKAYAPATVANVACGFDVFGLALEQPGDVVQIKLNCSGKVMIEGITGDNGCLPKESDRNTAGIAVSALLRSFDAQLGASLLLHKQLPLGSGIGSSAASAVAALVAANAALGNPFTRKELIPFALLAEQEVCGVAHADNVAPALFGGFVLVRDVQQADIVHLPLPPDLWCVVVHPHLIINTRQARMVLKNYIKLTDAVKQWANTAALVAALYQNDYALLGRSLSDVVAEPVLSLFIPGFESVKKVALQLGALGCSISGSGPSIFALCKGPERSRLVCQAMQQAFADAGLLSNGYVSAINIHGAKLL